jgi:hypothetical protein
MNTRLEYVPKAGISIPSGTSTLSAVPIGPTLMPTQYHVQWLPVTFFGGGGGSKTSPV